MTATGVDFGNSAVALRESFDRSFAEPRRSPARRQEDFLGIRLGGDPHLIRLADIAGLHAGKQITPLPGATADCLGIAGFRGTILPVYDLRTLMGYTPSSSPRWLVVASRLPIALAFDMFLGQWQVSAENIAPEKSIGNTRRHVHEAALLPEVWPIVDVSSVIELVKSRAQSSAARKEQGS